MPSPILFGASYVLTFLKPDASNISAAFSRISLRMAFSFAFHSASMLNVGKPYASLLSLFNVARLSEYGKHSPKPVIPIFQGPGDVNDSFNSSPNDISATPRAQLSRLPPP